MASAPLNWIFLDVFGRVLSFVVHDTVSWISTALYFLSSRSQCWGVEETHLMGMAIWRNSWGVHAFAPCACALSELLCPISMCLSPIPMSLSAPSLFSS